jgi:NAD(P)-dependent dehydrogenase (short-subunit alcohol dehydrogenase family)
METAADSVVLVTGGGRGIGRAIALALAQAGARVGVLARSEGELAETVELIRADGGMAHAAAADVTDPASVARAVASIERALGGVDGLVNNAGVLGPIAPFWKAPLSGWRDTIAIDLVGPAVCTHAVLPPMVARRRGRIVNVVTSMVPTPHYSAYGAAKAGLVRFSESLAAELKPHGVYVFAMGPGTTRTAMSTHSLTSPEGRRWIPGFARIFEEGLDLPMERPVALALALLSGRHDGLSGLMVAPTDDLAMIEDRRQEVQDEDLYRLRVRGVPNPAAERMLALRKSAPTGFSADSGFSGRASVGSMDSGHLPRRYDGLSLDADCLTAMRGDGRRVRFSRLERALLRTMTARPWRLFSREQLLSAMSAEPEDLSDRNVDFVVNRVRRKLGDPARAPRFIATQYGEGYMWIAAAEPAQRSGIGPDFIRSSSGAVGT